MDDLIKKRIEEIKTERKFTPLTKEETAEIVARASAESATAALNAILGTNKALEDVVAKVEKLASKEIIVNPTAVNVQQKEYKLEVPNEIKVSNLNDIELPTPIVEVTQEKVDISEIAQTLIKLPKPQAIPVGEGSVASTKADPTKYVVFRQSNGKQFIEPVGVAGGGGSGGERVWPLIDVTYDVSNNPVTIVKQDGQRKITQNIAYDGSNNPIRFTVKYDNI